MFTKMSMISLPKNNFNVAFFADGSFLPIRNGTYASVYGLMRGFYDANSGVCPALVLCDRGWDKPINYINQKFRTIFIKPKDYYDSTESLIKALSFFNIRYVHIYNAEDVENIGKNIKKSGIKIIYEAINIDHILYESLLSSEEVLKMKEVQRKAFVLADHIMCRSEIDKKHIIDFGISESKITIYNGAIYCKDITFSQRNWRNKSIVFLGHLFYPPNEYALGVIKKTILPQLQELDKSFSVTVIGSISDEMLEKYREKNLIFKKGIDDLGAELLHHDIAIAPLYHGSGTRVKILDYLASGLSVITTKKGIEGLHYDVCKHVSIVEDKNAYASSIFRITKEQETGLRDTYPGRAFVESHYDWANQIDTFISVYESLA